MSDSMVKNSGEQAELSSRWNTIIRCDSSSVIKLSKNPIMHGRTKHIDVSFHFLQELTRTGIVELIHCATKE